MKLSIRHILIIFLLLASNAFAETSCPIKAGNNLFKTGFFRTGGPLVAECRIEDGTVKIKTMINGCTTIFAKDENGNWTTIGNTSELCWGELIDISESKIKIDWYSAGTVSYYFDSTF